MTRRTDAPAKLFGPNERLREAMRMRDVKSAAELGRLTGIKDVTVRSYVNGGRNPPLEVSLELGRVLKVNGRWLFDGSGTRDDLHSGNVAEGVELTISPKRKTIIVYSAGLAGPHGEIQLMTERSVRRPAPLQVEDITDAYGVRVVGNSMEIRYFAGETVYVSPHEPIARNDYVVAQIYEAPGGGAIYGLIKRFVSFDGDLVLAQHNPECELRFQAKEVKAVRKIVLAG